MRKHRCPGSVKVARFPGISEVSASIPVSGLCFLLIFVGFALCLPCYLSLLSACTVTRGAPSTASCLTHSPQALHLRSCNIVHLCVLIVR